jgi:hypothetical protein
MCEIHLPPLISRAKVTISLKDLTSSNFGLLIAFLLPGFVALWGVSFFSETVRTWLTLPITESPTVGGFLYVTLASLAAGLTASTIRWAVIDTLHHATGIRAQEWDYGRLEQHANAYRIVNEHHYLFYLWYSNMIVVLLFVWAARHTGSSVPAGIDALDLVIFALVVIFSLGSRDTYRHYCRRMDQMFSIAKTDSHQPDEPQSTIQGTAPNRIGSFVRRLIPQQVRKLTTERTTKLIDRR